MRIYTMCVDAERGRYMAIACEGAALTAFSHLSEADALGRFVVENIGVHISEVISIETSETV